MRPTTRRSYEGLARNRLIPHLGQVVLQQLTRTQIRAAYAAMQIGRARRLSPAAMQRIHPTLRGALNAAVEDGLLTQSFAARLRLPLAERKEMVVWTPVQLRTFPEPSRQDGLQPLYQFEVPPGPLGVEAL